MNWQRYFSRTILLRGETYYNKGAVNDLQIIGGRYYATVRGSHKYSVMIWKKANSQLGMSCNCKYALDGNNCKHMAATFIAIEEEFGTDELKNAKAEPPKNPDVEVKPFTRRNVKGAKKYICYDLAVITEELKIMKSQLTQAEKMIENKSVKLLSVVETYARDIYGNVQPACIVNASYEEKGKEYPIRINLGMKYILEAACHVMGCNKMVYRSYYKSEIKPCKHMVATLLLLADYIDEHNPGDTTDLSALNLIEQYRTQHRSNVLEKSESEVYDLQLEPRIEHTQFGLELAVKAGTQKLYVLKSIDDFVDNVENKRKQQFGSKSEIDFGVHRVSEESVKYYDFLKRTVQGERLRYESSGYYDGVGTVGNRVDLYGSRLDDVYDIIKEGTGTIIYQNKMTGEKASNLKVDEKMPDIQLKLKGDYDDGVLRGIVVSGNLPEIIKGERYMYCLEDSALCRMDSEKTEVLMPLLNMANGERILFRVGRKSLVDFYYHTLPMLSEYVDIVDEVGEEMELYLPPKVRFTFYLDEEEGKILCDGKAVYGEEEISLLDCKYRGALLNQDRDSYAEREALNAVLRYCPEDDMLKGVFICEGDDNVCELLQNGLNELMLYGEVLCTDRVKRINVRKYTKMTVGVSLESGIMELDITTEDLSSKELLELLASYRKKKKYHRLLNGDFVNTEDENLEILASMFDTMHINTKDILKGKIQIPAYRALYLDKVLEKNEHLYVERDKHFKSLIKEFKAIEDSDFEVPASLKKTLRPYQVNGFRWLKTLEAYGFGGILADDMGLGKTLQVISVLLQAKGVNKIENKSVHKETYNHINKSGVSLIVAPASLIFNWKEEFEKFAPSLNTKVISGTQVERKTMLEQYEDYDVLITSYDLLKRDISEYEDKKFLYQIIDEAQYIKNHTTAAAKSVKCIQSKIKYALTGTPIENRLSELWSIFDYLMPGFLYGYETFRKELETPIAKNKDEEASTRLKRMVSPFIMRRLKQDVLKDLPDKLEEVQYTVFEEKQQKLYDGQVTHMREILNKQSGEEFAQNKLQILSELTKLREICCDPELLFENYDGESAKRVMCVDLVKRAIEGEHRVLIFSQFTSMLSLLEQDLTREGITYYKITGSTKKEERVHLVKQFNEGNVPVFLISLKAGGTGLNLTGADTVIHYDPWWNQAAQNQATDRAHRIGQKKVVTVYKLIAKGSIEEKILKMQEMKKNLADEILSGETGGLASMSRDELLGLLGE